MMVIISRIVPHVCSALQSHSPEYTNQSQNILKKDPSEGVTLLSQLACSVILCNWVSPFPKVLIQVYQEILVTTQTPPCSVNRQSKTATARPSRNSISGVGWGGAIVLAVSSISSRVKERFPIIYSFTFTPNQWSTAFTKMSKSWGAVRYLRCFQAIHWLSGY